MEDEIIIIPDITFLPVLTNCLYAFDIDNTLINYEFEETHPENREILQQIKKKIRYYLYYCA